MHSSWREPVATLGQTTGRVDAHDAEQCTLTDRRAHLLRRTIESAIALCPLALEQRELMRVGGQLSERQSQALSRRRQASRLRQQCQQQSRHVNGRLAQRHLTAPGLARNQPGLQPQQPRCRIAALG